MSASEQANASLPLPYSYSVEQKQQAVVPQSPAEGVREGRRFVVSGFVIAVLGIFVYCAGALATVPATAALAAGESAPLSRWVIVGLSMIGVGTVAWMIGMIRHLTAFLDLPHREQEQESPSA